MKYFMIFSCLYLSFMRAEEYKGHLFQSEGYLYPFPQECSEILDKFAQYASNFTMCSIEHARPIKLCSRCIDQYMNFYNEFKELDKVVNGTTCRSRFISHDRLDAVLEYYNNIISVWNKGQCNACYDWTGARPDLSNNTKRFIKMYNDTMECIIKNLNGNAEKVCQSCMQSYLQLDDFYKSLSSDSIGVDVICMDIVDSMNTTRSIWSKNLNCCKLRRTPEIIFLCCSGIISLLPLLYYVAVRYCGPIRDLPNVLKQSRFKQTFIRSMDRGTINQTS